MHSCINIYYYTMFYVAIIYDYRAEIKINLILLLRALLASIISEQSVYL